MNRSAPDPASAGAAQEVSEDTLLAGRVRLRQPRQGYRVAIDPVLLAAATAARAGEQVLDLGCGVGAAALCLLARVPGAEVTGLERQPDLAALARENAALNGCAGHFRVVEGNLMATPSDLPARSFHRVMVNPPFQAAGRGRPAPDPAKALATSEEGADLADWIAAALRLLRPRGRLTLIHRADRLDEIVARLHGKAGDIRICPLWPAPGVAAKRVLIAARKGVQSPLVLGAGLALHGADGGFSTEAERVLREGAALAL